MDRWAESAHIQLGRKSVAYRASRVVEQTVVATFPFLGLCKCGMKLAAAIALQHTRPGFRGSTLSTYICSFIPDPSEVLDILRMLAQGSEADADADEKEARRIMSR